MFVIGITGGTASGKTSLVNELKDNSKKTNFVLFLKIPITTKPII